jgi:hypothetical protein
MNCELRIVVLVYAVMLVAVGVVCGMLCYLR